MQQRPRIYYSEAQKAIMWERWRRGESLHDIAQLFECGHASIQRILRHTPAPAIALEAGAFFNRT